MDSAPEVEERRSSCGDVRVMPVGFSVNLRTPKVLESRVAMLKICRLLLVSLCQLTEDLVLVRNNLFKSFVGLGFVFLVFLGGRHWLLRLGYLLFVLPFFCGGCD